ncbi:MAG: hypothetical protein AB3N63_19390 [Puniceicoccaceae bacterium]
MKSLNLLLSISFFLTSICCQGEKFDAYGGLKAQHFDIENNGFFRTTKQDGKWWLVTPENNAFLAFGLNHFHSNLWVKEYNKDCWEEEFGGAAWSPAWKVSFHEHAKELVTAIKANSMGYHNEERILLDREPLLPYIKQYIPVKFSMHMRAKAEDYPDVFDPKFRRHCDAVAQRQVAPYVNDKMIIGFAMADIPVITERWSKAVFKGRKTPTWAMVIRNLPASAPGKQVYVETMKNRYKSVKGFNKVYGTQFDSWPALKKAEDWRDFTDFSNETEIEDNNAFNKLCIAKYYETASAAFRAVNKNHLFLGDKLNANMDPRDLELMIDAVKDHVDVVLYQFYGQGQYQEAFQNRIAKVSGLPMINGDGGFGAFGDPRMPNPQYPQAKNQAQRGEWMYDYAKNAFKHPNFVGWHICGVIDSWTTAPHGTQKPGIINPVGDRHEEVFEALSEISEDLYTFR